jgi:hypothetical protein
LSRLGYAADGYGTMAITPVRGVAEGKALVTITMAEKANGSEVKPNRLFQGYRCGSSFQAQRILYDHKHNLSR